MTGICLVKGLAALQQQDRARHEVGATRFAPPASSASAGPADFPSSSRTSATSAIASILPVKHVTHMGSALRRLGRDQAFRAPAFPTALADSPSIFEHTRSESHPLHFPGQACPSPESGYPKIRGRTSITFAHFVQVGLARFPSHLRTHSQRAQPPRLSGPSFSSIKTRLSGKLDMHRHRIHGRHKATLSPPRTHPAAPFQSGVQAPFSRSSDILIQARLSEQLAAWLHRIRMPGQSRAGCASPPASVSLATGGLTLNLPVRGLSH